jgi:four helix bundle protein
MADGIHDAGHWVMNQPNPAYENGQDIRDRAFEFACGVVRLGHTLYEGGGVGRILAPQLLNCSTSLAAMLEEARAAESTRDFVSKCSIGLKESRESHVRLKILEACRIGPASEVRLLRQEANELVAIISAIVGNTKRNAKIGTDRPSNGTNS